MKVVHFSTHDARGGAARAALRIHRALVAGGIDSSMVVQERSGGDALVFEATRPGRRLVSAVWRVARTRCAARWLRPRGVFSTQLLSGLTGAVAPGDHVVNLHWICDGFLGMPEIGRIRQPMVWTCHDEWPFTGGCHYSDDCEGFTARCGSCPLLASTRRLDASRMVMEAKRRLWRHLDLSIVCPSRWMAERVARSTLFSGRPIHVIGYPIDLDMYRPIPRPQARELLRLDPSRPTVLFSAMSAISDPRKGFDLMVAAISILSQGHPNLQCVVCGVSEAAAGPFRSAPVRFLGTLRDELSLVLAYSAADVFVAPSRQDNLPNTVAEALACGTPVAAFRIGGMPDMIDHRETGFLAEPYDVQHLAAGIDFLLSDAARQDREMAARRRAAAKFAPRTIAQQYVGVYSTTRQGSRIA